MRTLLISLVLLAGIGCDSALDAPTVPARRGASDSMSLTEMQPGASPRAMPPVPPQPTASPQGPADEQGQIAEQSMIIRTGHAAIEVDSLEPAIAAVRALATRVGGYVAGSALEGGDERLRSASLELKIPAARWSDVIGGLEPIGRVESVSENAQDVGEEFVDVTARLTNARRLEARLIELIDRRTGKLEDVLAVERELARVREEIERYEGRLRYLRSRVATSTLVVSLHEPAPLVGAPGENILVDAFQQSWRNFIQFLAWLISASGVLIPVAVLAVLAFLASRRVWGWPRPAKRGAIDGAER
jgi:hypothetical protein